MGLLGMLESLGGRLGIIEKPSDNKNSKAPAKIRTRVVTLAELKTELKDDDVRALAEAPAELTVPYERIYETAGIGRPQSGWDIEKLGQLVRTAPFKDLSHESCQRKVLEVLGKENVDPESLVKDAVARDQALDAFEKYAERKMLDRIAGHEQRQGEIDARIEELRKEKKRLEELESADRERWSEWQRRKRAHERELARTVSCLIDRPVITTDDERR